MKWFLILLNDLSLFVVGDGVRGGVCRVGWRHGYLAFVHGRASVAGALEGRVGGFSGR